MTIKQAIKILSTANRWRRGADVGMPDQKEFGDAIDVAIFIMETTLVEQPGLKRYHIKAKRHE